MMRVLVFGNSHVAAWRAGWDGVAAPVAGVEMGFFSLPEKIFQRYRFRATGLFAPRRSVTADELERVKAINDGQVECDPTGFDVAVCVGAGWAPEQALAFAALGDPPDGCGGGTGRAVYGPGFLRAALQEACAQTVAGWPVALRTRRRPIVFGRPVYAETCLDSTHRLYAPWHAVAGHPEAAAWFMAAYRDCLTAEAAEKGIEFLAPPDELQGRLGLTRAEFLAEGGGVVDPEAPGVRGDHSHMNAAYGQACIRHLLAHVSRDGRP